jgi:hypothetical protein
MRTLIALVVVVTAVFALGGCFFHHQQQAYVSDVSPEPYK